MFVLLLVAAVPWLFPWLFPWFCVQIREKMQKFRSEEQEAPSGLNPSTYRLMSRYLQQSDSLIKKGGNINHRSKVIKKVRSAAGLCEQ